MIDEHKNARVEQRLRRAMESLYGNEGLTADLDDSSALFFLGWAEGHVRRIVTSTMELEDAAADEVMAPRMKAIRRLARFVSQALSGQGDPFGLAEKIIHQARVLYGDGFVEPEITTIQSLLTLPKNEPVVLVQTLKHLLEGEMNDEEDEPRI